MKILPEIDARHDELTQWRRYLHMRPELGFEEFETADFVAEKLESWGLEVHRKIAGTGVVGVLRGRPGRGSVGLRADMDALPIDEANAFAHASTRPGKMHACGHDGHSVMLLGAARYLAEHPDFAGTVHFIFQPAEETGGGAKAMIAAGLFEQFPCDSIFALHNRPSVPLGVALVAPGPMMAGAAKFAITVKGVSGHAARPHLTVDPIVTAAQLVQMLQTIVSRRIDPLEAVVLTIASIAGGNAFNVIPASVVMTGTVRCFQTPIMLAVEAEMRKIAQGLAVATGADIGIDFDFMIPPTVNDPHQAAVARGVLEDLLGSEHVVTTAPPSPGSEDFSHMLDARPGAFIILGMREDRDIPMIHHASYDFNDALLPIGASYFAQLAQRCLSL